jgi:glycosyltransferase involved in cell wall biosynthesis
MSRFVKRGYKVAYIEPTLSMVRKPDINKSGYQTNRPFHVSIERKNENLIIIKPPRGMPFWSRPVISKLSYLYFSSRLSRILKKLGFKEYILWNYRPEYAAGIRIFNYRRLVYDITDDLAAYKQKKNSEFNYIKKCTEHIIKKSDLVIVTASTLFEKYKGMSKDISLIPNGYDSDLFSAKVTEEPDDLKGTKTPIIGFIGTLFSFLDYDLIEYVVRSNPEKSFVFIGHCEENSRARWRDVTQYNNVFWLGKKKKEDIPAYLNSFDVCINPFIVDNVSRSVSPLKVFEYLAMGKPVVSVRMESLEKEEVSQYIYFSSSYEDFNEKLNSALQDRNNFKNTLNYKIIKEYSWDSLFEKVVNSVEKL